MFSIPVTCCHLPLQLAVIPDHKIFLGLSDGEVLYADLVTFQITGRISWSQGATYFAVDWQKLRAHNGLGKQLRLCVATKKKLQLYEFKEGMFLTMRVRDTEEY